MPSPPTLARGRPLPRPRPPRGRAASRHPAGRWRATAVSVARSLAGAGVEVYAINDATAIRPLLPLLPLAPGAGRAGRRGLLGPLPPRAGMRPPPRGPSCWPAPIAASQVIARHRDELAARFRLDESNPGGPGLHARQAPTYQEARAAGVPTPRFWRGGDRRAGRWPWRVPWCSRCSSSRRLSHVFEERFGKKFDMVDDFDQLAGRPRGGQ